MSIQLTDGKYAVNVRALKSELEEASAMSPYLGEISIVTVVKGKYYLTFMLKEEHIIKQFQLIVDGKLIDRFDGKKNEDLNNRYEMFELRELPKTIQARVKYELTHEGQEIKGDEELRLILDEDTVQDLEELSE